MPSRDPFPDDEIDDRFPSVGLDQRIRDLETFVRELRPKMTGLNALLEDREVLHELVDDARFGRRIRMARNSTLTRCGKLLGVIGASLVILESIIQLWPTIFH